MKNLSIAATITFLVNSNFTFINFETESLLTSEVVEILHEQQLEGSEMTFNVSIENDECNIDSMPS